MRYFLACITIVFCWIDASAQTNTKATLSDLERNIPQVGFNMNSLTKPSWDNQSFRDSLESLGLNLIRYPGGTESQYFDWQTGKTVPISLWQNGTLKNFQYLATTPSVPHTLPELKKFTASSGVKVIFCLNLLTKSLSDQLQMLQSAADLGISVEYIELGNELYFTEEDFQNKYATPADYALDIQNNWIPQIKAAFPDAKLAVIGSYDGTTDLNGNAVEERIYAWNEALYAQNLTEAALTFHYYFPPNTTVLSSPNTAQALAAPFKHWPVFKTNTLDQVPEGMDVWITEYNLSDGNNDTYSIASSWTHALYTASIFSLLLEESKIQMIMNHQVTGSPAFASIASYTNFGDTLSNRITSEGNAMRLIHQSILGKSSAFKLNFSNNPNMNQSGITYPSLIGWYFEDDTTQSAYLLNLSAQEFNLDLSSVFSGEFQFEQITASDPLTKDITTEDLLISKGITQGMLQVKPFSISSLSTPKTITSVSGEWSESQWEIYPNPVQDKVILSTNNLLSSPVHLQISDLQGRLILEMKVPFMQEKTLEINTQYWKPGIYFMHLLANQNTQTFKLIKK